MKLPNERTARIGLALILVPALASCASHERLVSASGASASLSGPAADYPVVVGDPYKIDGKLYTPADTMNYDEVGYVAADAGNGVTASHHTLPLPSYVEVTSLDNGRTILVRVERRGPMNGNAVIALSPAALTQLGAAAGAPVRVRRVNPPEDERAALRLGRTAPLRMDTPAPLVAVLKRKLSGGEPVALASKAPVAAPAVAAANLAPSIGPNPTPPRQQAVKAINAPVLQTGLEKAPPALPPLPAHAIQPKPVPKTASPAVAVARVDRPPHASAPADPTSNAAKATGAFVVQAATMSTLERAQKVAGVVGGSVSKSGAYYRVRTGPFSSRRQAEASLVKVRAAGYSDARIVTNG